MRYKLFYLLAFMLLCILVSACGQQQKTPGDEAGGEKVSFAESEMPVNTPEHQEYVERFLYPFVTSGLFLKEFSPQDMSAFEQMDPTDFGYFYLYDDPDNSLGISDAESQVEGDVLEGILMAYLPLTPEQIRDAYATYYDGDRRVYTAAFGGLGGGPAEFIITDSRMENGVLFLHYDLYGGDPRPDEEFHWALRLRGQLQIEIDGDAFKFVANTVQQVPERELS